MRVERLEDEEEEMVNDLDLEIRLTDEDGVRV
jgi:hypothetical protein